MQQYKSLVCPAGHCFDLARQGYVNLLRSSSAGAHRHGDDRQMVRARTAFLDAGFYNPLRDAVTKAAARHAKPGAVLLDAGCGEGFYTSHIRKTLEAAECPVHAYGIDVSRDAIIACAARDRNIRLAVASISDIPAAAESVSILINLFAPYHAAEFFRVLKPGGILLRAFPRERHLWELKAAVYDMPYENVIDTLALDGFELLSQTPMDFEIKLDTAQQIDALFKMTPYYYKTSREGQARLAALTSLIASAQFMLAEYRKTDADTPFLYLD